MVDRYDQADLAAIETAAANNSVTLNEDSKIYLATELNYVKRKLYEEKLPPMNGLKVVPISREVPVWAETYEQKTYDSVGMAKIIANYADDLPRSDVARSSRVVKGKDIGASFGYNFREMQVSAKMGDKLPLKKGLATRRSILIKHNSIVMEGDEDHNLYGLTNHPNIGLTAGLNGGWATATGQQMLDDLFILYDAVTNQSNGVHTVNSILLSPTNFGLIGRTLVSGTIGKTVKEMFLSNYPSVSFASIQELHSLTHNIIAGEFNIENISAEIPDLFTQHAGQARNLEIVVPCTGRSFGVDVPYPLAFTKGSV